jgi:hypothetical protein
MPGFEGNQSNFVWRFERVLSSAKLHYSMVPVQYSKPLYIFSRVVDPDWFNTDPDPAIFLNPDPDPDPDPS